MKKADDSVKRLVDSRLEIMCSSGLMKSPSVPKDMVAGPEDEEGWLPWVAIPSRITQDEIHSLEEEIGYKLPDLYIELLLYKHFIELDCGKIKFLPMPSDEGIGAIRKWYKNGKKNSELVDFGLLPFALAEDDESIYCFITSKPINNESNEADYPVGLWDLENSNINHVNQIYSSFFELVEKMLA